MDFSLVAYREILEHALSSGFAFVPFTDDPESYSQRRIYLRHDVDYSPEMAVEIARVNRDACVSATFFFLVSGRGSNLLAAQSRKAVRDIQSLGQLVGLHAVYDPCLDDTEAQQVADAFAIASCVAVDIAAVFSWHNPSADLLGRTSVAKMVAGLVNAYSARFVRDICYASDSNMRNHPKDILEMVGPASAPALQLLLHPLYWVAGGSRMEDAIAGTWPYLIRNAEAELRENGWYRARFPNGAPTSLAIGYAEAWRRIVPSLVSGN